MVRRASGLTSCPMEREVGCGPVEQLIAWQRAMDLVVEVYRWRIGSRSRAIALADQLRRAASSIPANIAEGNARAHRREYVHFLSIARGSLAELATHLESARRVGYLRDADLTRTTELIRRVRQLLTRLMNGSRLATSKVVMPPPVPGLPVPGSRFPAGPVRPGTVPVPLTSSPGAPSAFIA